MSALEAIIPFAVTTVAFVAVVIGVKRFADAEGRAERELEREDPPGAENPPN